MNPTYMESTLAGTWYDDHPGRLRAELTAALGEVNILPNPNLFAVIMPHAGYAYSGRCAAHGAQAIAAVPALRRVIVLGFTHRIQLPNAVSLPSHETAYRSPLGETPLDTDVIAGLLEHSLFTDVPVTRRGENSVEMQLPLLQVALEGRDWALVPITLGQLDEAARSRVAQILTPLIDAETILVVSSDFTHYGPDFGYVPFRRDIEANLRQLDGGAIQTILNGDAQGFATYCKQTGATICGQDTIGVLLRMLPPGFTAQELAYDTSGRSTGDFTNSVSYAAAAFYRPSQS